jgi:hypothetical protein
LLAEKEKNKRSKNYIRELGDKTKALERLSFRGRPFSEKTRQKFITKQAKMATAQHKRMKSAKALSLAMPPHVLVPPEGNDVWKTDKHGMVERLPLGSKVKCPKCGKELHPRYMPTHIRTQHAEKPVRTPDENPVRCALATAEARDRGGVAGSRCELCDSIWCV